jgi:hypothetical protein
MNFKQIILALILFACFSSAALADGGFNGTVTYKDCTCNTADKARIQPTSGGQAYEYNLARCGGTPGYTTQGGNPETFAPGTYYVSVVIHTGSDCDHTFVQYVNHGTAWQTVDLTVYGPAGGGTGPDPGDPGP